MAEDLLSYRFILTKHRYEKGTTFQRKIHERGTLCQNSISKGKGLDLEAKPLRTKLY